MLKYVCLCLFSFLAWTAQADVLDLKDNYPQKYVVKKGDTLWDISALFLKSPWRWPELWQVNPQIADPHWIYPGDTLSLVFVDGQPQLVMLRGKKQLKSSPHGRKQLKGGPIPTVPLSSISHYLSHRKVLLDEALAAAPMVTGGEKKSVFYTKSDVVFVNAELPKGALYGVYRLGRAYYQSESNIFLGQEIELVATGRSIVPGPISRLELLSSDAEVRPGQRLLMLTPDDMLPAYFSPTSPATASLGEIIALDEGVREVGKNAIVTLNIGSEQGTEVGQVLSVYRPGLIKVGADKGLPKYPEDLGAYDNLMAYLADTDTILQPDVYRGNLMVFRVFDKISYAIMTDLHYPVRIRDLVSNP